MIINKKLNLVVPIEREDGPLYVHATPISKITFEAYFVVIAKTFAAIYSEGLNVIAGPRVATLMLRKVAEDMGVWEGPQGVKLGLMNEIIRLANVCLLDGEKGWTTIPLYDACRRQLIDEDELSEVEGAICFFILASSMHRKKELASILGGASRLWGLALTSFNSTEFTHSLTTSTGDESTGEKVTP